MLELVSVQLLLGQYGGALLWLHVSPSAIRNIVITSPSIEEIIPNKATIILGILLIERIGSCCSLSTHSGGNINAKGMAASTPCKYKLFISS